MRVLERIRPRDWPATTRLVLLLCSLGLVAQLGSYLATEESGEITRVERRVVTVEGATCGQGNANACIRVCQQLEEISNVRCITVASGARSARAGPQAAPRAPVGSARPQPPGAERGPGTQPAPPPAPAQPAPEAREPPPPGAQDGAPQDVGGQAQGVVGEVLDQGCQLGPSVCQSLDGVLNSVR